MLYKVKDAKALGWVEEWERRCGWTRTLSNVPGSAPGLGAAVLRPVFPNQESLGL